MKPFWMCWVQKGGRPMRMHETLELAREEAGRLARKQEEPVYILQCIGTVELADVPTTFKPCEG